MTQHTPTPWHTIGGDIFSGEDGILTCIQYSINGIEINNAKENAEFIVRCVNSHGYLVSALEYLQRDPNNKIGPCSKIYLDAALAKAKVQA